MAKSYVQKPKYYDHFGKTIRKGCIVAFAKVVKDAKTGKKNAILLSGEVVELVFKNDNTQSVKIEDPVTHKISNIRRLDNIVVLAKEPIEVNSSAPEYFEKLKKDK